jgi:hypothetical protein
VKLAIQIAAGILMAVLVVAVGSRRYITAELKAATAAKEQSQATQSSAIPKN